MVSQNFDEMIKIISITEIHSMVFSKVDHLIQFKVTRIFETNICEAYSR